MLGKIKNIKKKIKYAKIGAIIFAIVFVLHLILSSYMMYRITNLQSQINQLEL